MAYPLRQLIAAWLLVLSAGVLAQVTIIEVITLRHRTADELVAVLEPLAGPGGHVAAFQQQLIVRAAPSALAEIRRIVSQLDTPPRQLLVTVRQESRSEHRDRLVDLSGSVGGDHGRIVIPDDGRRRGGTSVIVQEGDARLRARARESDHRSSGQETQTIRVLEGRQARIHIGQSVPVGEPTVRRIVVNGRVVEQVIAGTAYRDVMTGFFVVPRLSGDRVTLAIRPERQALSGDARGAVAVQAAETTVSGALGEWIEIGAIDQDASGRRSVLFGRSDSAAGHGSRILVKVDLLR